MRRTVLAIAFIGAAWAIGNAAVVYFVLGGAQAFRLESALWIFGAVALVAAALQPREVARGEALTARQTAILLTAATVLWVAVLAPLLRMPFLSEDYGFLAVYRHPRDVLRASQFFRPVFALAFLLLATAGGGSVMPFHLAAAALHVASAALVFVLTARLVRRRDVAALVFAIVLLNPLQLEPVLWASGLQELLWTFFVLAGLAIYTAESHLSGRRAAAALACVACALLAKETAIAAVALLPAADWAYFRMRRGPMMRVMYGAMAVVAVAYLVARAQFTTIDATYLVAPGKYFLKQFAGTPYRFFVHPWNAAATAIHPVAVWAATTAVVLLVVAAIRCGIGRSALAGPMVILLTTLPVYAYLFVAPDLRGSRYLYFPAIGWALLIAQLVSAVTGRARVFAAASAAIVAVAAVSLSLNTRAWRGAAVIVNDMEQQLRAGRSPQRSPAEWQAIYGPHVEVRDGIPTVYKGVYLFVNSYPEFVDRVRAGR